MSGGFLMGLLELGCLEEEGERGRGRERERETVKKEYLNKVTKEIKFEMLGVL